MSTRCFNHNCKSQSRWQICYFDKDADEEIYICSCANCLPLLMSKKYPNTVTTDSSFVDKVIDFFTMPDNIISNGNEEKESN